MNRFFLVFSSKHHCAQKMKFPIKDFFSKCEEILNGKPHFLFGTRHLEIAQKS